MSTREREIAKWIEERQQLAESGLSRREVARMGLLTTAAGAVGGVAGRPSQALADGSTTTSPWQEAWAWQDPMPIPPPAKYVGSDLPNCNHAAHQYYDRFPCQAAYQMFGWRSAPTSSSTSPSWPARRSTSRTACRCARTGAGRTGARRC